MLHSLFSLMHPNTQHCKKTQKPSLVSCQLLLKRKRNGSFGEVKETRNYFCYHLLPILLRLEGFLKRLGLKEIKEREIEKIVRDEIVNFLKVNQELKMYMIYNSKLEREQL